MKLNPDWLNSKEVQSLGAAFKAAGFELRFVGGCVRDSILKREVTECDAATNATPDEMIALLEKAGLRAIPTGIQHGTITALVEGKPFEVTTLRRDVSTDGRHAKIAFSKSWEEDAKRRDFTMNALYLALDGTLYDFTGGLSDCKAGNVVFIGDASARIKEDYLRILRYFRFVASIGDNKFDPVALAACRENKQGIRQLSGERITTELLKLLSQPDCAPALYKMHAAGVLDLFLPKQTSRVVEKLDAIDASALVKLAALIGDVSQVKPTVERLKLSSRQTRAITLWLSNYSAFSPEMSELSQKKMKRKLGDDYLETLQVAYALSDDGWGDYMPLVDMRDWEAPLFPVMSADLMRLGFAEGKALGDALKNLETAWEESGYAMSREELLATL